MELYDVECPICGHLNRNCYLEETEGWMECESCHTVTNKTLKERETFKIPVFSMETIGRMATVMVKSNR